MTDVRRLPHVSPVTPAARARWAESHRRRTSRWELLLGVVVLLLVLVLGCVLLPVMGPPPEVPA